LNRLASSTWRSKLSSVTLSSGSRSELPELRLERLPVTVDEYDRASALESRRRDMRADRELRRIEEQRSFRPLHDCDDPVNGTQVRDLERHRVVVSIGEECGLCLDADRAQHCDENEPRVVVFAFFVPRLSSGVLKVARVRGREVHPPTQVSCDDGRDARARSSRDGPRATWRACAT